MNIGIKKTLVGYGIVSSLHLANFMAYWSLNSSEYRECIIFVEKYWDKIIVDDKYLKYCKSQGIKVFVCLDDKKSILKGEKIIDLVFIKDIGYKATINSMLDCNFNKVIVVDEGVSSYTSYSHMKRAVEREKGVKLNHYKYFFKKIISSFLCFFFRNSFEKKRMFISGLEINPLYKKGLLKYFSNMNSEEEVLNLNNVVLYCSQPYVELGIYELNDYLSNLKKLKNNIEKKGLKLLIKPHPVEKEIDYKAMGFNLLDYNGMIEEYVYINRVGSVISNNSTSSLLLPAIYGVESFIFNWDDIDSLGGDAEKLFKRYCKKYTSISLE